MKYNSASPGTAGRPKKRTRRDSSWDREQLKLTDPDFGLLQNSSTGFAQNLSHLLLYLPQSTKKKKGLAKYSYHQVIPSTTSHSPCLTRS